VSWRLGVAGFPVDHSLSPRLHEVGLVLAGLEGSSARVEVREAEASRLTALMHSRFDALSVTMPLKVHAARICDWLDEPAQRTGVVNSLLARDGQVLGACTDGQGFVRAIVAEFAISLSGANVAVLVDCYENVYDHEHSPSEIDLIVNTTPSASRTAGDSVVAGTGVATLAVDITYEPRMSPWRTLYEQAGCRSTNGLGMLAFQAALQMEWWWDTRIDAAVLLEAIL